MGRARNLAEFNKPFPACGSVFWVNILYADTSSQAFYIEGTSAPSPSSSALAAYAKRVANDTKLPAPARGLDKLYRGGIAYDAPLHAAQYEQQSGGALPGGTAAPSGDPISWLGNPHFEGGLDRVSIAAPSVNHGTRVPGVAPASTTSSLIGYGTSWHSGLNLTANAPEADGLVSYSQSNAPHRRTSATRTSGFPTRTTASSCIRITASWPIRT